MKFKYSVIGDNTQANREWLRSIGWRLKYEQEDANVIVCASNTGMFSIIDEETQDWFAEYSTECLNCRSNTPLFQAVAAIREDSDYLQWFVITRYNEAKEEIVEEWRLCKTDIFDVNSMPYYGIIASKKATLEELTEKFKSEKK